MCCEVHMCSDDTEERNLTVSVVFSGHREGIYDKTLYASFAKRFASWSSWNPRGTDGHRRSALGMVFIDLTN